MYGVHVQTQAERRLRVTRNAACFIADVYDGKLRLYGWGNRHLDTTLRVTIAMDFSAAPKSATTTGQLSSIGECTSSRTTASRWTEKLLVPPMKQVVAK